MHVKSSVLFAWCIPSAQWLSAAMPINISRVPRPSELSVSLRLRASQQRCIQIRHPRVFIKMLLSHLGGTWFPVLGGGEGLQLFLQEQLHWGITQAEMPGNTSSGYLSYGNSDATHTCSFLHVPLNLWHSSNSDISTCLFIKCPHLNSLKSSNRRPTKFYRNPHRFLYARMWIYV